MTLEEAEFELRRIAKSERFLSITPLVAKLRHAIEVFDRCKMEADAQAEKERAETSLL